MLTYLPLLSPTMLRNRDGDTLERFGRGKEGSLVSIGAGGGGAVVKLDSIQKLGVWRAIYLPELKVYLDDQ